jgi:hypothetical protein
MGALVESNGEGETDVRLGVIFPQTEIGADPGAVRDFARAAEALGYDHLHIYDHVIGADPERKGGWTA